MEQETHTNWVPNPITVFLTSFAVGVFLASVVPVAPAISLLVIFIAGAVLTAEKLWRGRVERDIFLISLALLALGTGFLRYAIKDFHEVEAPTSTGVVIGEPEDKENTRRFVYEADNGEKVLVSAPLYTPVAYGDKVEVRGSVKRPGIIEGESGKRDFDYGAYLAKDDIYWVESFAEVEVLTHNQGNPFKALLLKIKNNFIAHIQSILPEPQSSLLAGLIVAGKGLLPEAVLEDFRRAGVVHIVVLSGFNITLIAEFLRRMFQKVFLWIRFARFPQAADLAAFLGIILFVIMTGAEATVVRAALMASIAIAARAFGRNFSAPRALFFAAFLMLVENPKILVFDPSFQLSFLATLGLIYFMSPVEKRLHWVTERLQLKETLAQTIATQLTVLPLLVYLVGDISLVSLPANILILLIVPWTMLVGFIAVLLAYISAIVAWPLAFISHLLLSWILFVAHLLGSLNFAVFSIPNVSVWVIIVVYVALGIFVWRKNQAELPAT